MELSDLIIKTNLSNTTPYGCIGNSVWDTQDQVFVESIPEFEAHAPQESSLNRCFPTAYALINHAIPYKGQGDLNWKLTERKQLLFNLMKRENIQYNVERRDMTCRLKIIIIVHISH